MKKLSSITFSFIPHQDSHLVEMGKKLRDVPGVGSSRTNQAIFPGVKTFANK